MFSWKLSSENSWSQVLFHLVFSSHFLVLPTQGNSLNSVTLMHHIQAPQKQVKTSRFRLCDFFESWFLSYHLVGHAASLIILRTVTFYATVPLLYPLLCMSIGAGFSLTETSPTTVRKSALTFCHTKSNENSWGVKYQLTVWSSATSSSAH